MDCLLLHTLHNRNHTFHKGSQEGISKMFLVNSSAFLWIFKCFDVSQFEILHQVSNRSDVGTEVNSLQK